MTNIAILASGSGSNAENIARYFANNSKINVALIISNKHEAFVHQRAKQLGIPSITFSKQEFDEGSLILDCLLKYAIDFVVLAGFLLKVNSSIIQAYQRKIINIHPALLPKFGGKGMYGDHVHKAVIASCETESGITIHHVNEKYDDGAIIFQAACQVLPNDTHDDLAKKIHELEYHYFPRVIHEIIDKTFGE